MEIAETLAQFESLASTLTQHVKETGKPLRAKFPTGVIRRIADLEGRWPFLDADRRRTVACTIQLLDVVSWNLNHWKIGLTAGTMWEWHCTLPIVAVVETILREYALQNDWVGPDAKFEKVINTLNSKGVYPQALRDRLQNLRKYRNQIHLFLRDKVSIAEGVPQRFNRAVLLLGEVEKVLSDHWEARKAGT